MSSLPTSSSSIGVNLRVTGHCHQGGRKYMEDVFSVAYQQTADENDLEYAFFGIFDGHGGREAALFAKENLLDAITKNKNFWSDDDDQVLRSIRDGFLSVQRAMVKARPGWQKTASGLASTAGTTASICFIKRGKLFIGHCGDSGIVLGEDTKKGQRWRSHQLTVDHKPEDAKEHERITKAGGKVVEKSGVPRVVWYRPKPNHQGPVRRSTAIDEVPFLAVARALGDLWSYNAEEDVFIVSPEPDVCVVELDVTKHRCIVLATDGAWNVLNGEMVIDSVYDTERNNERYIIDQHVNGAKRRRTEGDREVYHYHDEPALSWVNPSKRLVDEALERWNLCGLRADNTSIVTVLLDPPGPPRAQVLKRQYGLSSPPAKKRPHNEPPSAVDEPLSPPALPPKPVAVPKNAEQDKPGVAIISRFPNSSNISEKEGVNLAKDKPEESRPPRRSPAQQQQQPISKARIVTDSTKPAGEHPVRQRAPSASCASTPLVATVSTIQEVRDKNDELEERKATTSRPPRVNAARRSIIPSAITSPKPPLLPKKSSNAKKPPPVPPAPVQKGTSGQQQQRTVDVENRKPRGLPLAQGPKIQQPQQRRSLDSSQARVLRPRNNQQQPPREQEVIRLSSPDYVGGIKRKRGFLESGMISGRRPASLRQALGALHVRSASFDANASKKARMTRGIVLRKK